ncbi:MAG: 4-alpha-glucanotransferase [Candidatus Gastranaerophilales bacterium]|nr:4-alpha-glucanotransferase [Candidatus Gastranaerophilales bacterium]
MKIVSIDRSFNVRKSPIKNSVLSKNIAFGRALTPLERQINAYVVQEGLNINGIDNNAVITPAAAYPAFEKEGILIDTGVGSSCSQGAKKLTKFFKDLFAFNACIYSPEGIYEGMLNNIEPENKNISPYSSTVFSLGTHLIDPANLLDLRLVSKDDINKITNTKHNDFKNNYVNYFTPAYENFLDTAYQNFKKLDDNHELKKNFAKFKNQENLKPWLDSDARYHVLAKEYWDENFMNWSDTDKKLNIYLKDESSAKHQEALVRAKMLDNNKDAEFYKFCQFVISMQKKDFHEFAKNNDFNLIADVPIGWHKRDVWRKPAAFDMDMDKGLISTYACPMPGWIADWGLPALKSNSNEANKIVKEKYDNAFKNHDGVRIDAAWQMRKPFIKKGEKSAEWSDAGESFYNTLNESIRENNINKQLVFAEIIGSEGEEKESLTNRTLKTKGIPKIDKSRDTDVKNWYTLGVHDDLSLISNKPYREAQVDSLTNLYIGQRGNKGARNVQVMFSDVFGMPNRYNDTENFKNPNNWKTRMPKNYEEFYYRQISEFDKNGNEKFSAGLNMPEVVNKALKRKDIIQNQNAGEFYKRAQEIKPFLEYFEKVLKSDGPMTTDAAQKNTNVRTQLINELGQKEVSKILIKMGLDANRAIKENDNLQLDNENKPTLKEIREIKKQLRKQGKLDWF